ncbi:MAG: TIR domain-containing protein [Geobacteraceae bacterium]|uniref:TIR domain-containing protein n=1 Tax=Sulfuricurvum sp. TaxID=2025608 RepID=UPI003454090F|nr:TIR domain-containing protein [Geobacteraceae bacterium]NTW78718.1 TIR domain-containing protein [Geobacteraceae bacterium]
MSNNVRHKVFITYHHADQEEVNDFITTFSDERNVFISRVLGVDMEESIISSTDTDYVMKRIRELYLKDSTVTIVLMGKCTWARRYVDWEIQSSLRSGNTLTPNGLLGIKLPSFKSGTNFPNRLNLNLKQNDQQVDCYARWIEYPTRKDTLANAIHNAFLARTSKTNLIVNPRDRFVNNRSCQ